MKIIVPIKQVPETTIKPKIAGDGTNVDLGNVKMVMNPFDEFAVEEAIKTVEEAGSGSVTLITFGDADDVSALRTGLAMGADEAVRIKKEETEGESDTRAVAQLLAGAIKAREYDAIFCGKLAVGSDNAQVPQMLAALLNLPVVTAVTALELSDSSAKAQRQIEGKTEVVEIKLPGIVSFDKGVNEPRYPKLKGIMKAKKAAIEELSPAELGVDTAILGAAGSQLEITSIELPPAKGEGILVEIGDDPEAAADKLVDWLKNEIKVL